MCHIKFVFEFYRKAAVLKYCEHACVSRKDFGIKCFDSHFSCNSGEVFEHHPCNTQTMVVIADCEGYFGLFLRVGMAKYEKASSTFSQNMFQNTLQSSTRKTLKVILLFQKPNAICFVINPANRKHD